MNAWAGLPGCGYDLSTGRREYVDGRWRSILCLSLVGGRIGKGRGAGSFMEAWKVCLGVITWTLDGEDVR